MAPYLPAIEWPVQLGIAFFIVSSLFGAFRLGWFRHGPEVDRLITAIIKGFTLQIEEKDKRLGDKDRQITALRADRDDARREIRNQRKVVDQAVDVTARMTGQR